MPLCCNFLSNENFFEFNDEVIEWDLVLALSILPRNENFFKFTDEVIEWDFELVFKYQWNGAISKISLEFR